MASNRLLLKRNRSETPANPGDANFVGLHMRCGEHRFNREYLDQSEKVKSQYKQMLARKNRETAQYYTEVTASMLFFDEAEAWRELQPYARSNLTIINGDLGCFVAVDFRYNVNIVTIHILLSFRYYFYCYLFTCSFQSQHDDICRAFDNGTLFSFELEAVRSNDPLGFNPDSQAMSRGDIVHIDDNGMLFDVDESSRNSLRRSIANGDIFNMTFTPNRMSYRLQHEVLRRMSADNDLFTRLVTPGKCVAEDPAATNQLEITETQYFQTLNDEQRLAVKGILNGQHAPLPYLVFGPPGTGKTRTIIGAIEQIVRFSAKRVLVCAMSNAACDEITERLLKLLGSDAQIYRIYARGHSGAISSTIQKHSNRVSSDKAIVPTMESVLGAKVVVCTLFVSGYFMTRNKKLHYDAFGYTFIDECASAPEILTLVAFTGNR